MVKKKKRAKVGKLKFVWKTKQLKLFFYWMNERQKIWEAKKAGKPFPWTDDKILQTYKFTNVFRQLDRVTEEWTKRYVTLLGSGKESARWGALADGDLLFHVAMFRLFNWPETYDALHFGMTKWNVDKAIELLSERRDKEHEQIFTGAYIIPQGGSTDPKIDVICRALDFLHDGRTKKEKEEGKLPNRVLFANKIRRRPSMERAVNILMRVPTIGGFIGYEIACDLRHTRLLADAYDIKSWANPGPGAMRGIHRLMTGKHKWPKGTPRPDYVRAMRMLLRRAERRGMLGKAIKRCEWPFEMREIEHSLCEFDKYCRVKFKEGKRPRSVYRPPQPKQVDMFDEK